MPEVILRHLSLPEETAAAEPPAIAPEEYTRRCDETLARSGLPWVAVYGDREHNANLLFLTGFDPRFEEELLLLGPQGRRVLLVGNEGIVHAAAAGMALQCDIIPTPLPPGTALNREDSVVLGDDEPRADIASRHPDLWGRIERNRDLMQHQLGLTLRPETLPLSLANAYLPPGWLAPNQVCALT